MTLDLAMEIITEEVMSDVYEARQVAKRRAELYREVAAKKHGVPINLYGHVAPMNDGAFVEIVVWVPLTEIEIRCPKHDCPVYLDETCQKCTEDRHGYDVPVT